MSVTGAVVCDTGPLISLERLSDGYDFIRKLYGSLLLPTTVAEELCQGEIADWSTYEQKYSLANFVELVEPPSVKLPELITLDLGERDAIQLACDRQLPLLIEEEAGRRIARTLGLYFSGIAGQILKAKRLSLISEIEAQSQLTELLQAGRIGKRLHRELSDAVSTL